VLPFVAADIVRLFLVLLCPALALWLVRVLP
jgi:TRAP-type C4-dicarboxylate transport system permease large subunit